jgi:ELWxxDGT repeat protein
MSRGRGCSLRACGEIARRRSRQIDRHHTFYKELLMICMRKNNKLINALCRSVSEILVEALEDRRLLSGGVVPVGASGTNPTNLTVADDLIFFRATGSGGAELWRSDGTDAGTFRVKDINPGSATSNPRNFVAGADKLYFLADDGVNGTEIWSSDGTEAGTVRVTDLAAADPVIRNLTPAGADGIYFTLGTSGVNGDAGDELWKSAGPPESTALVSDLTPSGGGSNMQYLTYMNGEVFFAGTDGSTGFELWKSDGTAAGTSLVKDLAPGPAFGDPLNFVVLNDKLLFGAAHQIWISDGTTAGTVPIADVTELPTNSVVSRHVVIDGTVYFNGATADTGFELWKTDGTSAGTMVVADLTPGSMSSLLRGFGAAGDTVFFSTLSFTGSTLWMSDGTAAGTVTVQSSMPPAAANAPASFAKIGSTFYFATDNALYQSDGTPAGTELLAPVAPTPATITAYHDRIYFATDGLMTYDHTPVANAASADVAEDGSVAMTLAADDIETPAADLTFRITSLPTRGTLLNGTEPVALNQAFVGSPSNLTYVSGAVTDGPGTDSFTFTASDGTFASDPATVAVNVSKAVADGAVSLDSAGILRIAGTTGDDAIIVQPDGGMLDVQLNGARIGQAAAADVSAVRVWGRGGDDSVDLSSLTVASYINGGAGNNTLIGGLADDVLIGRGAADALTGSAGNDLLIGGDGDDRLVGAAGDDILIAGDLAPGTTLDFLHHASALWTADHAASIDTTDDAIVTDDGFDRLTGGSGADWFIVSSVDHNTDVGADDLIGIVG